VGSEPPRLLLRRIGLRRVGELWFDSRAALDQALVSPEMAAAFDVAKHFLDMDKTEMLIVSENTTIG
jgi:hypothetical protein